MKTVKFLATALIACSSVLGLLASGCAGEVDNPEEEAVGEAESAITFAGCSGETGGPSDSTSWTYGTVGPFSYSNLPYGNSTCEGFNVNYTNTVPILPLGDGCFVQASWYDSVPTTQATCTGSSVAVATYNASGTQIAVNSQNGSWVGGTCLLPGFIASPVSALVSSATHSVAIADRYSCGIFCGHSHARVKTQVVCDSADKP